MSYWQRLVSVALCMSTLTFFVDSTSAAAFKRVHRGETAPTFTLPDLDGTPVKLEDYKDGPLTIVCFWAMWSPKSLPLLQDLGKILDEYGQQGVRVKALAVDAEGENPAADLESQLKEFVAKNGIAVTVLVDKDLNEYNRWGVIAAPSTAFLVKDLQVAYEFSGHPTSAYEDMREQVRKILGIEEEEQQAAKPRRERYRAEKRVILNYGLARTLFQRGQFAKAARKLKKVLEEDPQFPDAHALNGAIHLGLVLEGRADAGKTAREEFQKAVDLDATEPLGLAGLAHFALEDGELPKALELTRKAVEFTEDGELPSLAAAPAETPASPSASGAPVPVETESAAEPGAPQANAEEEGAARQIVSARLDQATAALEGRKPDEAKSHMGAVVEALIDLPQRPEMNRKGTRMMEMMKKMRQAD